MKTKIGILVLALCTSFFSLQAQRRVTTARAASYDISDNLDLDAVASIFGDSENLEDFERRLNDPDNRISNLDLNEDGYIDYLRVLENSSDRNSLVVVQAVLDEDVYQDVATIEIERVQNGNPRIQIVGDSYIYGSNYIIEPVFVHTPLIFSFFWSPRYITYHSPYYWDYYPSWYSYYRPYPTFKYHRHVYGHINRYNTYQHTSDRHFQFSGDNYNHIRRSDYATRYPDRAFVSRNREVSNRNELIERRSSSSSNRQKSNNIQQSGRDSRKSTSVGNVNERRRSGSNVQSGTNPNRTRVNNNVITTRERPNQSGGPQFKSASKKEGNQVMRSRSTSTSNRSADQVRPDKKSIDSRSQTISRPTQERSTNRVEAPQRSSAPREKSGSVSGRNRSNSEVKQAAPSVRKSDSPNKDVKKAPRESRKRNE